MPYMWFNTTLFGISILQGCNRGIAYILVSLRTLSRPLGWCPAGSCGMVPHCFMWDDASLLHVGLCPLLHVGSLNCFMWDGAPLLHVGWCLTASCGIVPTASCGVPKLLHVGWCPTASCGVPELRHVGWCPTASSLHLLSIYHWYSSLMHLTQFINTHATSTVQSCKIAKHL